ncbi:MAG: M13 family metallopeptidase [bacterium]|nr:M13 family metallopeptidase [bacterium]
MKTRLAIPLLLALSLTPGTLADARPTAAHASHDQASHPLLEGGDRRVRPQDDLYRHANGTWLRTTPIPGDRVSYGVFDRMAQRSEVRVRELLTEAMKHPGRSFEDQILGDLYASLLDTASLDQSGLEALRPLLDRASELADPADLAPLFLEFSKAGARTPVALYVAPDEKKPTVYAAHLYQDGIGLPDRDYYLNDGPEDRKLREGYLAYLTTLARLSGSADPAGDARATLDLETAIARVQWSQVECRDDLKAYNPLTRAGWSGGYAPLDFEAFARAAGLPPDAGCIVAQPTYVQAIAGLVKDTPLSSWQAYLRLRILDAHAMHLGAGFRAAYQHFHREQVRGMPSAPPRWRTALRTTSDALGEAIGIRYVARHFPQSAKRSARRLVDHLLVAYRRRLEQVSWMSPTTRQAALRKLDRLTVKIGYPDRWRGHDGLVIRRDDGVGNLLRVSRYHFDRDIRDVGQPVDRTRWEMPPQMVNAYYNPVANEIVFPAAILQDPFFDPAAEDARNFGAIGAIIGHEISHGFDDSGRHYDADGSLRDWWTPEDARNFEARAARLVKQYGAYTPLPGLHVNGQLTLGENIADLAGVTMAFEGFHLAQGKHPATTLEGLTGDQRFFLSYARSWRSLTRPQALKEQLLSDPHSPDEYRTNGVVTNLDAFHRTFGLKPGDRLYQPVAGRIRIW